MPQVNKHTTVSISVLNDKIAVFFEDYFFKCIFADYSGKFLASNGSSMGMFWF